MNNDYYLRGKKNSGLQIDGIYCCTDDSGAMEIDYAELTMLAIIVITPFCSSYYLTLPLFGVYFRIYSSTLNVKQSTRLDGLI